MDDLHGNIKDVKRQPVKRACKVAVHLQMYCSLTYLSYDLSSMKATPICRSLRQEALLLLLGWQTFQQTNLIPLH
jgi:hypothetical protein